MGIALAVLGCVALVAAIGAGTYWAFTPIIDDQNRRIQESKRRNPELYAHLSDKLFPWDKD